MSEFYFNKPADFDVQLEVSTVFMEHDDKLLLLQRGSSEWGSGTWAVPGGKLEKKETPLEGLIREIKEELCLCPSQRELAYLNSVYVHHPRVKYHLHLFQWKLLAIPKIVLNPNEHTDFLWQPISEFANLHLLEGQLEAFRIVYGECLS